MKDQKQAWNRLQKDDRVNHESKEPTDFAKEIQSLISPKFSILELGCGVGIDSYYFAQNGNKVLGTDFSEVAIDKNKESFKNPNLTFEVLDISKPFAFPGDIFDLVYARLSLHYFTDKVTKEVFKEIYRILKPGGILAFICKSIKDPLYGQGEQIEKDMFLRSSHVRHFFSKEYAEDVLRKMFEIKKLEEGEDIFYKEQSSFIKIIATKI